MTSNHYEAIQSAAAAITQKIGGRLPKVGLVLGSGLGAYADRLVESVAVEYGDIPGFPVSRVVGHAGRLVVGKSPDGPMCAAMQGRVHYYEGHDLRTVTFPIRTLVALGCRVIILTNAAGGINQSYTPGDLILLHDHINLMPEGPLRGENDDRLGTRFPDMTRAYAPELRALVHGAVAPLKLKEGVYAALPGPSYETPAEIRYLRAIGADLCGMSTVPETIVAVHQGARVIAVSCVTNMAAGVTGEKLSHEEVTETAGRVRSTFTSVLDKVLVALDQSGELVA